MANSGNKYKLYQYYKGCLFSVFTIRYSKGNHEKKEERHSSVNSQTRNHEKKKNSTAPFLKLSNPVENF